jgi:hypothetical protein
VKSRRVLLAWILCVGVVLTSASSFAQSTRAQVEAGRESFPARRARGIGRFLDSTQLRRLPVQKVSSLLEGELGMFPVQPPGCRPATNRRVNCVSTQLTRVAASRSSCALKVLLDGVEVGPGGWLDTAEPPVDQRLNWLTVFDVATVSSEDLDMIELYRQEHDVPSEFQGRDTQCGLLLLWTRED